jgi:hypothetical protein
MVSLDQVLRLITLPVNLLRDRSEKAEDPPLEQEEATDKLAQALNNIDPASEAVEKAVESIVEFTVADLQDAKDIDLEDVEDLTEDVEGNAVTSILALGLTGSALESASLGQVDQQQEFLMQATSALALDDVTGTELRVRLEEGLLPAAQAKYGAEHRSKFADLQDAVEIALRNKTGDSGYLDGSELPDEVVEKLQSDEPVNPDNLIEVYGIKDNQLQILEEAAIRSLEPEELIETPAEAGIVPDDTLLKEELDRAGISEGAKELFEETVQEIPKTTRVYEERIKAEELVNQLDELVAAGELTPDEALERLGFLGEETQDELRTRFEDLRDLPSGPPTRSQVESGFQNGLIGLDRFTDLLETVDVDTAEHPYVADEAILSEIDGDLRQAVGLGLITAGQYRELAEIAGLDEPIRTRLLEGEDLDEIAESRLQEKVDQGTLAVDTVSGIGEVRSTLLEEAGIGTVGALANASPAEVARLANVSEDTATGFIDAAGRLVGENS